MATTRQLPSGKHQGIYRDGNGKQQSAGTFPHKRAAMNAASAAEQEARSRSWRDPAAGERPWGEWCEEWWPTRKLEASSAKNEAGMRDTHLLPRWAEVPLCEVTRHEGRKWIAELMATETPISAAERKRREDPDYEPVPAYLAASSVQRIFGIFSASIMAAVDAEILPANPLHRLKLPSRPPAQERYFTKTEYQALDAVLETNQDAAIIGLLIGSGMRWGEAMGLHTQRIDRERGMIHIVETWDPASGRIKPYPKGKLARSVPLLDWVVELMDELGMPAAGNCGHAHQAGVCRSGLVLHRPGEMADLNNWRKRVWARALADAGLGHARPHDLRHTYASWAIQGGVSLEEVARLLGHASPSTTKRYAHLAELPAKHVTGSMRLPGVRVSAPGNVRISRRATNVQQTPTPQGFPPLRLVT